MTIPAVDVVVLTWNDGDLLGPALDSVLRSQGVEIRLIVVDNASDPPADVLDDERLQLLRNEANLGVAGGRNRGARLGSAPFLLFLDSDARLLPDTLTRLMAPLLAHESVGVSVPVFVDQAPTDSAGRTPTPWVKLQRGMNRRSDYEPLGVPDGESWEVDFGIGACQLIRRAAFDAVGGLDESIHFGPEDLDFCLRVKDRGWTVVQVGAARCIHPPRRRFKKPLTWRGLRHGWTVVRFYFKRRTVT